MSKATGRSCSREPPAKQVKRSRVYKGTIDSLSMGEGIIEGGGRFQPFGYNEIPFPDWSLLVRPKAELHRGVAFARKMTFLGLRTEGFF